jgi:hypothetical protein
MLINDLCNRKGMIDFNKGQRQRIAYVCSGQVEDFLRKYKDDPDPSRGIQEGVRHVEGLLRNDYQVSDAILAELREIAMETDLVHQKSLPSESLERIERTANENRMDRTVLPFLFDYTLLVGVANAREILEARDPNEPSLEKQNWKYLKH